MSDVLIRALVLVAVAGGLGLVTFALALHT